MRLSAVTQDKDALEDNDVNQKSVESVRLKLQKLQHLLTQKQVQVPVPANICLTEVLK